MNFSIEFESHKSILTGFESKAKLLIENGAYVNACDEFEITPLHWAALNGEIIFFFN